MIAPRGMIDIHMKESHMPDRPTSVIYGLLPDGGLALLESTESRERVEELQSVMVCRTVGDVRVLAPRLAWLGASQEALLRQSGAEP